MMGAIAGDMIGAPYEGRDPPPGPFALFGPGSVFTDDSVLTVAVAEALIEGEDFGKNLKRWARRFPEAGYGPRFKAWAMEGEARAGDSFGNGAAMRVSPVGWAARSAEEALALARAQALPSHDHPDAIAAAQAVALAIYLVRQGASVPSVRAELQARFGYVLHESLDAIPRTKGFDTAARSTVPPSLACALAASDWEEAVRAAICLGADADTQGAIAGALAEARFGLSKPVLKEARRRLDSRLRTVADFFPIWLKRRRR